MSSEERRSASIARHFALAADLMKGREHDRHTLAARLDVRPAMADRLLNAALEHLPGVTERREGKRRIVRMNAAAGPAASTEPSYPTAVAACFGASLWHLFEGSSYQAGIRDALSHVVGRTKRRAVFRHIDRKFWFLRRGGESALLDRAPLLDDVLECVLHHRAMARVPGQGSAPSRRVAAMMCVSDRPTPATHMGDVAGGELQRDGHVDALEQFA